MSGSSLGKVSETFLRQAFLVSLESAWYFSQKAKSKACGCVGEIQMTSNVQSLETHMPHNVKAFLFTIYNASTPWFTEASADYLHRGLVSAISDFPDAAPCCRPTKWFFWVLNHSPRYPTMTVQTAQATNSTFRFHYKQYILDTNALHQKTPKKNTFTSSQMTEFHTSLTRGGKNWCSMETISRTLWEWGHGNRINLTTWFCSGLHVSRHCFPAYNTVVEHNTAALITQERMHIFLI